MNIVAILGDTPEQVVDRALTACRCNEPEGHAALAPNLRAMVVPNGGDQTLGTHVLVIEVEGVSFDLDAEGVMPLVPENIGVLERSSRPH